MPSAGKSKEMRGSRKALPFFVGYGIENSAGYMDSSMPNAMGARQSPIILVMLEECVTCREYSVATELAKKRGLSMELLSTTVALYVKCKTISDPSGIVHGRAMHGHANFLGKALATPFRKSNSVQQNAAHLLCYPFHCVSSYQQ